MAKESSKTEQGVASFSYCIADKTMPVLFELGRPLDELEGMLLKHFAGRKLSMKSIFEEHNIGRPYIGRNYKDALLSLERKGEIVADPKRRPMGTFGEQVVVTFSTKPDQNE
jgi:hypothetical protein